MCGVLFEFSAAESSGLLAMHGLYVASACVMVFLTRTLLYKLEHKLRMEGKGSDAEENCAVRWSPKSGYGTCLHPHMGSSFPFHVLVHVRQQWICVCFCATSHDQRRRCDIHVHNVCVVWSAFAFDIL